jgi:hypothetical protein
MRRGGSRRMFSLLTWRISTLRSGDIDDAAIDFGSGGRRCRDFGSWGRHRHCHVCGS